MDFTSLFKYTDIRIQQLQKEEIIDKKLKDSKIAYNSVHNIDRPSYLCRNSSGVLHDTSKPKFTRPETGKPY